MEGRAYPTVSIAGLVDLLTALEDELDALPGAAPALARELRQVLEQLSE